MSTSREIDSHQKAYVCIHVFERTKPILLVSRADGDWCFLCGTDHFDDASEFRIVGINHLFDADPTLREIEDLPAEYDAEREAPGKAWIRTRCDADNS